MLFWGFLIIIVVNSIAGPKELFKSLPPLYQEFQGPESETVLLTYDLGLPKHGP